MISVCVTALMQGNARDAMEGSGSLTFETDHLHAERSSELVEGEYIRVRVVDSGGGMDATTLARARDPFFTTKGVGKGTGLRLSMVHRLAIQSGGSFSERAGSRHDR